MRVFRNPQVNFYVRDVEAAARFYTELFDFTETFRTPTTGTPEHVELRLDGFILGLASIESARRVHDIPADSGPPRAEVCLWTDDIDRTYTDLLAKGAQPVSPPHDFLNGRLRAAWVADPDGNPIQLVAEVTSPAQ
ncbi:MAG: VOC family protein [Sphaerobacter sp.]|nr:VOC family protein [Sphaerobacter sp.]